MADDIFDILAKTQTQSVYSVFNVTRQRILQRSQEDIQRIQDRYLNDPKKQRRKEDLWDTYVKRRDYHQEVERYQGNVKHNEPMFRALGNYINQISDPTLHFVRWDFRDSEISGTEANNYNTMLERISTYLNGLQQDQAAGNINAAVTGSYSDNNYVSQLLSAVQKDPLIRKIFQIGDFRHLNKEQRQAIKDELFLKPGPIDYRLDAEEVDRRTSRYTQDQAAYEAGVEKRLAAKRTLKRATGTGRIENFGKDLVRQAAGRPLIAHRDDPPKATPEPMAVPRLENGHLAPPLPQIVTPPKAPYVAPPVVQRTPLLKGQIPTLPPSPRKAPYVVPSPRQQAVPHLAAAPPAPPLPQVVAPPLAPYVAPPKAPAPHIAGEVLFQEIETAIRDYGRNSRLKAPEAPMTAETLPPAETETGRAYRLLSKIQKSPLWSYISSAVLENKSLSSRIKVELKQSDLLTQRAQLMYSKPILGPDEEFDMRMEIYKIQTHTRATLNMLAGVYQSQDTLGSMLDRSINGDTSNVGSGNSLIDSMTDTGGDILNLLQ